MNSKSKKKIIHIALSGANGRMGISLQNLIKKSPQLKLTAKAHRKSCFKYWQDKTIDGVIDFSAPSFFNFSLDWAIQYKKAFVSGTTALNSQQKENLKKASKKIPVFYSENMSPGIFLMSQWIHKLFNPELQILLEDIHHKNKKDKPSGTALKLKDNLPAFLHKNLKIKSYRQGKEFGLHRLTIKNKEEVLILEHIALNRDLFSKGALHALIFILGKKKGFYDLSLLYRQKKLSPLF
ncbi:MAG: hypothetical protein OXC37_03480 [Bdellovibrionaceae bacterium]|nr:hypothetical protein [Pseudobdellovibrionaceae bacterium]